jgi:type II secretory pathway component PulJ
MDINQALDEVVVNQLAIARQSIEDRDRRIWELQKRVELLEQMLNQAATQRFGVPAPQTSPRPLPKRWAAR